MEAVIPLEQAVAYDTTLLAEIKSGASGGQRSDPAAIAADIEATHNELRALVARVNEIYHEISRNVYSTSQLSSVSAPPSTRVVRAIDAAKLGAMG